MKKSLIALATLAALTPAFAQSSVTLFGAVDVGVARVRNGSEGSKSLLQPGAVNTSRFGMRGVEDLGGGLRASFYLESQILPDTGAAGAGTSFLALLNFKWVAQHEG